MSNKNRSHQQHYLNISNVDQNTETTQLPTTEELLQQELFINETVTEQSKVSITQPQKGFNPVYKIELDLISYAEAMDKKNVMVPEQGGKWQYTLFKTIKNCFTAATQDIFNTEFGTVVNFFQKNKEGIFNEKFIFRFPENWPGSQNEYTQNRRLIYLIIQTSDPKTRRKNMNDINMEMVAEGMSEVHKQLLFNYYIM